MVKLADLLLDEHADTESARLLYRRAINLNPAGKEVCYSYGLFMLQNDKNFEVWCGSVLQCSVLQCGAVCCSAGQASVLFRRSLVVRHTDKNIEVA